MSKEQTPITAEGILAKEYEDYIYLDGFEIAGILDSMEQYAQAKLLEALEREFKKVAFMLPDGIPLKGDINYITGEQHYETEVKPKYKQINK